MTPQETPNHSPKRATQSPAKSPAKSPTKARSTPAERSNKIVKSPSKPSTVSKRADSDGYKATDELDAGSSEDSDDGGPITNPTELVESGIGAGVRLNSLLGALPNPDPITKSAAPVITKSGRKNSKKAGPQRSNRAIGSSTKGILKKTSAARVKKPSATKKERALPRESVKARAKKPVPVLETTRNTRSKRKVAQLGPEVLEQERKRRRTEKKHQKP